MKATLTYCMIAWMIGLGVDVPNYFGWGSLYYDRALLDCLWDRLGSKSYVIFLVIVSVIIPAIIFFFFYLNIFIKVTQDSSHPMKVTKGLFAACIIFLICYIPVTIVIFADFDDKLPKTYVMYVKYFFSNYNKNIKLK